MVDCENTFQRLDDHTLANVLGRLLEVHSGTFNSTAREAIRSAILRLHRADEGPLFDG